MRGVEGSNLYTARLRLEPGADRRAPGGAITVALCGSWDHDGPCVWPHLTEVDGDEPDVTLRTSFQASAAAEPLVRDRIDGALRSGSCVGPDGRLSRWSVVDPAG